MVRGVTNLIFFFLIIVLSQLYGHVFLWIPGLLSGDIEFNPGRNIPIFLLYFLVIIVDFTGI